MDDDFLLNRGAVVACLASLRRFESTQINNMLMFIQNNRNIKELELLIMRQAGRGVIKPQIRDEIVKTILYIKKSYQNEDERVEKVKKFLGYVKWLYESLNMKSNRGADEQEQNAEGNRGTAQQEQNAEGTQDSEEKQLRKAIEECYKLTFDTFVERIINQNDPEQSQAKATQTSNG
ncbi:MAG: hypothetical protein QXD10_09860 [Metallosphaera sp.]|uniref:hypothetical protein n=1 Tax=Metallosphaera sp. TaxID=2020860 RepID=UPI003161DDE1